MFSSRNACRAASKSKLCDYVLIVGFHRAGSIASIVKVRSQKQEVLRHETTDCHLQPGIAACHCAAKDYESTDWRQILSFYDGLVDRRSSR